MFWLSKDIAKNEAAKRLNILPTILVFRQYILNHNKYKAKVKLLKNMMKSSSSNYSA